MRRMLLTAAAAFLAGGISTGAMLSYAQPAPPPHGMPDGMMHGPGGPGGPGNHPGPMAEGRPWMHGMHRMCAEGWPDGHPGPFAGGPAEGMRAFALVYRQADRALTPADVRTIAEAFLLWNGNHTWKVADAATRPDGRIGFSLTTASGAVIATFAMDPHTARLTRTG